MKSVVIVCGRNFKVLESEINKLMNKGDYIIRAAYADVEFHYAILEKQE